MFGNKMMRLLGLLLAVGVLVVGVQGCGGGENDTSPPDNSTLEAPSNLTATPGINEVELTWRDNSDSETGFELKRKMDEGSYDLLVTLPAGTTQYLDSSLSSATSYTYRIRAIRQKTSSSYSNDAFYKTSHLKPLEDSDLEAFIASDALLDGDVIAVAFSNSVFSNQTLNINLGASKEAGTVENLPEGFNLAAPRISLSIPKADLNLDALDDEAEILIFPNDVPTLGIDSRVFALIEIETATGDSARLELPYDPEYPQFPIELRAVDLRAIEQRQGLTNPIRIRVFPLQEDPSTQTNNSNIEPQVENQDFGLFRLAAGNYELYREDCESNTSFQTGRLVTGEQNLNDKTPLVLIHGWQTLGNYLSAFPAFNFTGRFYAPHICAWIEFMEAFQEHEELFNKYQIYSFSYDSDRRIAENAYASSDPERPDLLSTLEMAFPDTPVVIVAHSMGGLVASSLIRQETGKEKIRYIVTAGTPYRGVAAITCKVARNGACEKAVISPEVKKYLVLVEAALLGATELTPIVPTWATLPLTQGLKATLNAIIDYPGTKDLAFEEGLGFHRAWETQYIELPDGLRIPIKKYVRKPNVGNPFLEKLNEEEPSPTKHFSLIGNLAADGNWENITLKFSSFIISKAYGFASDGIVTIESGKFAKSFTTPFASDNVLDFHERPNVNHNSIHKEYSSSNPESSLSTIIAKLATLVSKPIPVPAILDIDPNPVIGSDERQTISILGENLELGSIVTLRSQSDGGVFEIPENRTTFIGSDQIDIFVNVTTQPDTWTAEVENPDGQTSNRFEFQVVAPQEPTSELSGTIANLPSGTWRVIPYDLSAQALIGASTAVTGSSFTLDISDLADDLATSSFSPPSSVTLSPADTQLKQATLLIFDDADGDGAYDSGEQVHLVNDPENTFPQEDDKFIQLWHGDQGYSVSGASTTTTGSTVNWDIDVPAGGWARWRYGLTAGGSEVLIDGSSMLTGLELRVGEQLAGSASGALRFGGFRDESLRELLNAPR